VVQSLTWALERDRPQRRRFFFCRFLRWIALKGRRLTRRRSRSKFDEAQLQRFGQQAGSIIFIIFFLFLFLNWFFFCPLANTSILQNAESQNFLMCKWIFISKNSQNRMVENRGFCKSGNKNIMIYQKKHNGISVRNLCGSNTQIWTQTKKIKSTKVSKHNRFQIKNLYQKQETNNPKKSGFDDKYGNTRLDKTYRFRK